MSPPDTSIDEPQRVARPASRHRERAQSLRVRRLNLHGERIAYRQAGSGPVIVLIHGITSSSETWQRVMPYLARRFTVLAPDLIGHGESAKPRGDYSLGAHASGIATCWSRSATSARASSGIRSAAASRCSSHTSSPSAASASALRQRRPRPRRQPAAARGNAAGLGDRAAAARGQPAARRGPPRRASARPRRPARGTDFEEIARGHATLSDAGARAAFLHTLRAVVEPGGQRIDASNRLYLAREFPFLLVWGEHESIIPAAHGRATHARLRQPPRGARRLGHFPQLDEPERFLDVLIDFIDSTEPATLDRDGLRELLAD